MSKISNTLSILTLLSSGRKYTAKELSELIEVTPRQIRTYMEELEKVGIYVEVVKGRYGGYHYQADNCGYKIHFDISEVNTLEKIYLSLKDKIDDEKLFDSLGLIIEKMRFIVLYSHKQGNMSQDDSKKMYNLLLNAIYNDLEVTLFINKNKQIIQKKFIPHSIYVNNNTYYVTGYCSDINDIRTYPFFEISEIKI
ncbi:predicted transcriptional regulator [Firmicutes bacterium CAG:884]|nr:predicted transcriptional regulator [Firmicutes bacterium CAG:884]